jgi:hypothetical protein
MIFRHVSYGTNGPDFIVISPCVLLESMVQISPRSNDGQTPCLDLTPEIYPPSAHSTYLNSDLMVIENSQWDPMITVASPPELTLFLFFHGLHTLIFPSMTSTLCLCMHLCTISSDLHELSLLRLPKILLVPTWHIVPVLKPLSLLYLPSMTSICCL